MKKRNKGILRGKIESPVALEVHHHLPDFEQDHGAFADGLLTQTTDFDYDEIDRALGLVEAAPPDVRQQAGELVRELFQFCFGANRKKLCAHWLRTATLRFAVVASATRPEILNDLTHGEIASQLGLTKAAASKALVLFEDKHGIKLAAPVLGVPDNAWRRLG